MPTVLERTLTEDLKTVLDHFVQSDWESLEGLTVGTRTRELYLERRQLTIVEAVKAQNALYSEMYFRFLNSFDEFLGRCQDRLATHPPTGQPPALLREQRQAIRWMVGALLEGGGLSLPELHSLFQEALRQAQRLRNAFPITVSDLPRDYDDTFSWYSTADWSAYTRSPWTESSQYVWPQGGPEVRLAVRGRDWSVLPSYMSAEFPWADSATQHGFVVLVYSLDEAYRSDGAVSEVLYAEWLAGEEWLRSFEAMNTPQTPRDKRTAFRELIYRDVLPAVTDATGLAAEKAIDIYRRGGGVLVAVKAASRFSIHGPESTYNPGEVIELRHPLQPERRLYVEGEGLQQPSMAFTFGGVSQIRSHRSVVPAPEYAAVAFSGMPSHVVDFYSDGWARYLSEFSRCVDNSSELSGQWELLLWEQTHPVHLPAHEREWHRLLASYEFNTSFAEAILSAPDVLGRWPVATLIWGDFERLVQLALSELLTSMPGGRNLSISSAIRYAAYDAFSVVPRAASPWFQSPDEDIYVTAGYAMPNHTALQAELMSPVRQFVNPAYVSPPRRSTTQVY